jgi:uncharacterized protein (DUF488 family)
VTQAGDLWTIGHSTHTLDAFVALLRAHEIEAVADIRTVPRSRRHPHFRTEALATELPARDIAYEHLARLGGWRHASGTSPNTAWRNDSFRGYADHMLTDEFHAGFAELTEVARRRRTAMMCSEALWWRCHRRLVADHAVAHRYRVLHIGSDARATAHVLTAFAHVDADGTVTYPGA